MTKIADLNFKTKILTEEESDNFDGLLSVCTAVIKNKLPFEIIVVRMVEYGCEDKPYVIMFIEKVNREPVKIDTIIPKNILDEVCPDNKSEITIDCLSEETANQIIEVAETFGNNVTEYLNSIKKYSDRILSIPTTLQ